MSIYLSGSIVYDRIMYFPGKFSNSVLPDQIHNLNVSFFIDRLMEKFGGNAGNIAYTLALLGERPIIVSTVGRDFGRYKEVLTAMGLSLEGIWEREDELCSACYIITDQDNNQITAFHAAAMTAPNAYDFPRLTPAEDIALIGPCNPDDMTRHPRLYCEKGVRYIYDPAQQLPMLTGERLLEHIAGAYLLIGNEYEMELIMNMTDRTLAELRAMTVAGVIVTYGEKGSAVFGKEADDVSIACVPVAQVADPTGAGDAYRAGLIKGLVLDQQLVEAARLGATCAAFCVEREGTQGHSFTIEEFFKRHSGAFGEAL